MIISGFTGIGKSTIARLSRYNRIIDLESSDFFVNGNRIDKWYEIYCKIAKRLSDQGYIVFVSCHKDVRNYLKEHDIKYVVIYPSKELEAEWTLKLKHRYNKNQSESNLKALQRVENNFLDDVNDIIKHDDLSIPIIEIDYALEDYISEAIEMIDR